MRGITIDEANRLAQTLDVSSNKYYVYMLCKNAFTDAETVYMIDDNKKNIEGAISCNLNGIVFTNNKDLKEKLDIFLKNV